ncbi:MAG: hypothetical protein HKN82_08580 [Akkermansiaceae bacterium]|nr:hypothetical protein [Akkermansiaceae bacterium]NNM28200.1 hypothetical protein [Akkermansiaceae bacterium]
MTLLATGAAVMAGLASAEIEGELHAGWNSEYIFRGADQGGDSMTEAGIDFGTDLGQGFGLNAGIWYASVNGKVNAFDEVDYYGGINKDLDLGVLEGNLEIGYIYYDFPTDGASPGTSLLEEVYFAASTTVQGIDLGLTYFWDIEGDNDGYTEATADWSTEMCESTDLNIGLVLSYDWETSDLHHLGASVSLDYALNDVLTISPYIAVTLAEDGVENGAGAAPLTSPPTTTQDDEFWGGIILTAGF